MNPINIKYFNPDMPKIKSIDKGDWLDVRVDKACVTLNDSVCIAATIENRATEKWSGNKNIHYEAGEVVVCRLGIAMELPSGYEAEIKPRSGTFKQTGLLLTNSVGCIDESYKGNNDEWLAVFYATRDGYISEFDRLLQFRINEKMPKLVFNEVDVLENEDRSGYGSTGVK
jgi:dUTP pyrophosphatase